MEKRQLFSSYTFKYILINLLPDVGHIIASQVCIIVAQDFYVDFTTPCITKSKASGFTPDLTQELVIQDEIRVGQYFSSGYYEVDPRPQIYRGTLDGTPVVVKIVFASDKARLKLREEMNNYFALEDLQGTVIPRCYHYVIGSTPIKGQTRPSDIECLILEDCGKAVEYFPSLKLKDRYVYVHFNIIEGLLICLYHLGWKF